MGRKRLKNKMRVDLKQLDEWIAALNKKVSIRVGIIGNEAYKIHKGSTLTNAELGAVHEFGAAVNAADKIINIPVRSFLREPILGKDGKKEIQRVVKDNISGTIKAADLETKTANRIIDETVHLIAETALYKVQTAFTENKIKPPTTDISKKRRRYNPDNPTLMDSSELLGSITYEIKDGK